MTGHHDRRPQRRRQQQAGFTLAELIVASMLLAIVMGAVYTSFQSALNLWRQGDQHFETYQEMRTAASIMTRELNSIVPGSDPFFIGDDDEVEFFAVVPPMDPDEGSVPRVMWINYRLKRDGQNPGKTLERREAIVEEPLPIWRPEMKDDILDNPDLGRTKTFDLAYGLEDFKLRYWWTPELEVIPGKRDEPAQFVSRDPIKVDENKEGWGIPQGIELTLIVDDEFTYGEDVAFTTFVAFRGPTTPLGKGPDGGPNVNIN